jgi:hypothetical protein
MSESGPLHVGSRPGYSALPQANVQQVIFKVAAAVTLQGGAIATKRGFQIREVMQL